MSKLLDNWIWCEAPISDRGFVRLRQLAYHGEVDSLRVGSFYVYRFDSLINSIGDIGAYIEDEVYGAFLHGNKLEIMKNPQDSVSWIPVSEEELEVKDDNTVKNYCIRKIEEDIRNGQSFL